MIPARRIGIRWTLGEVSDRGFEALRLSILGAWNLFGPQAAGTVCVNTISPEEARIRTGAGLPENIRWIDATSLVPPFLAMRFGPEMAEGVGWKLAPIRIYPDRFEISLDNDCILWEVPESMAEWIAAGHPGRCLMAEDVRTSFGRFADLCPPRPLNAGIRGLPPGFRLEAALRETIRRKEAAIGGRILLSSELDEQGLQAAALSLHAELRAVSLDEVTVCSPFWPHQPRLGRCGAHFVGLNAEHIPWNYYDRPADDWMTEHWNRFRPEIARLVGAADAGRKRPSGRE